MRSRQNAHWKNRQLGGQDKRLESNREHNLQRRFYESNGPDVRVRGPVAVIAEKYLQLARDAWAPITLGNVRALQVCGVCVPSNT
jgi:Domain of unknown function (DUF4167)